MNKNCGIYKITSPAGRIYIGQSANLKKRFRTYSYEHQSIKRQIILHRSFLKYGVENHQFDIIEYCSENELNCSERFWQDEFDVLKGGLNCILQNCGVERKVYSQATKDKIGLANRGENSALFGKKQSKEFIALRVAKVTGENHYMFGKSMKQETKEKMLVTFKKNSVNIGGKNGMAKLVICLETGIFYESLRDASNAYNINIALLGKMLNKNDSNINRTSLIYAEDYKKENLKYYLIPKKNKRPIKVINTNTNYI